MIEEIAGERLTAGPGERPKWRRHCAARQAFLCSLPDGGNLSGEVEAKLRHQRRRSDGGVAADENGRIQGGSGKMTDDDPGEDQPPDDSIRVKLGEAIGRTVDFYARRLPCQ